MKGSLLPTAMTTKIKILQPSKHFQFRSEGNRFIGQWGVGILMDATVAIFLLPCFCPVSPIFPIQKRASEVVLERPAVEFF
jgi:hypothetical protein